MSEREVIDGEVVMELIVRGTMLGADLHAFNGILITGEHLSVRRRALEAPRSQGDAAGDASDCTVDCTKHTSCILPRLKRAERRAETAERDLKEARDAVDELNHARLCAVSDLRKYGDHEPGCSYYTPDAPPYICTCGLTAALDTEASHGDQ